ncbi:MAG TPA: LacI family DNA-binding transcriptional regulator [Kribbella sp.]|uniref:LacI family DNA-binding transcriptional regulator n=1 Tax=Kribbella sp. TaxID=1871183 RepID=UPI002D76D215|nr:LacI family DNA-binding transcriptional regulator [Kribbella sp.]HET6293889.1 LacI family DNA-binding transcriptional regulator [Kribbella sp.]
MTSSAPSGPGSGARRPTQADVAKHAGVSVGIVSSVINDRQYGNIRISDRTRLRVLDSIRELGYSPNIAARNLARGANKLLGVFSWQRLFPLLQEDFFYEFLVGIEEAAEDSGYNLLMLCAAKDESGARSLFPTGANGLQLADGGILLGWDEKVEQIRRLQSENYPFVFVGERRIDGVEASWAGADYVDITASIVDRLAALGHSTIGLITQGVTPDEPVPGRRAGFAQGAAGNPRLVAHTAALGGSADAAPTVLADEREVLRWLRETGVTGLVVESSGAAVAIREAAAAEGMSVPSDFSLVGLSGTPEVPGVADLTELSIPRREMGREAVALLVRLLRDPARTPLHTTLSCSLREAGTLDIPPARSGRPAGLDL